jgi:hypothetical protein
VPNLAPHFAQKFARAGLRYPQERHATGSSAPQAIQNRLSPGIAALQLGHSIPHLSAITHDQLITEPIESFKTCLSRVMSLSWEGAQNVQPAPSGCRPYFRFGSRPAAAPTRQKRPLCLVRDRKRTGSYRPIPAGAPRGKGPTWVRSSRVPEWGFYGWTPYSRA